MFGWFKKQSLEDLLSKGHAVRVHGVVFRIRKINPIDFATGARAVHMYFQVYKTKPEREQLESLSVNQEKIKEHFRDVIMASVISPKLSRKENEEGSIFVDNLFTDWDLATELYNAIIEYTHGKKKLKLYRSLSKELYK